MKTPLLLIAATGAIVAGLGGYAVLGNTTPESDAGSDVAVTTAGFDQPGSRSVSQDPPRRQRLDDDDDSDDRYEHDDDDRPYRNQYRQGERRGQPVRGRGAPGPQCGGYVDADSDGVCDECARTPRGCSAGPNANVTADPYPGMPTVQDYERATTLANMQAAFNGESNAHAKYLGYAEKADEEGYAGVASLFRAAAEAESIHAENHAEVIRQLGAKPEMTIKPAQVRTTRENLEDAISGESYEWDVMYPGMLSRARRDRDRAALRSFNFAMTAKRDHAKFYRAALADLDNWQTARSFFVCTVCGETVDKIDFTKCPSCFVKVDEYIEVK